MLHSLLTCAFIHLMMNGCIVGWIMQIYSMWQHRTWIKLKYISISWYVKKSYTSKNLLHIQFLVALAVTAEMTEQTKTPMLFSVKPLQQVVSAGRGSWVLQLWAGRSGWPGHLWCQIWRSPSWLSFVSAAESQAFLNLCQECSCPLKVRGEKILVNDHLNWGIFRQNRHVCTDFKWQVIKLD